GSSPSEGSHESPANTGLSRSQVFAPGPAYSGVEQILEQPDERGRGFVVSLGIKASDHEDQLDPPGPSQAHNRGHDMDLTASNGSSRTGRSSNSRRLLSLQ